MEGLFYLTTESVAYKCPKNNNIFIFRFAMKDDIFAELVGRFKVGKTSYFQ